MKVTFALVVENEVYNFMRRTAYEINKKYGVGFYGAQLPAHISLKQPFIINDIYEIEEYFDNLAKSIAPIDINITGLGCWVSDVMGSIYLNVEENVKLRNLHNRINEELAERFDNTEALFDGDDYRFHATIALGGTAPKEVYKEFYNMVDKNVSFRYKAKEIVMFYYDDDCYKIGSFMTFKKLQLQSIG